MNPPRTSTRRASAAVHFRDEIVRAEARGARREDMTLHLTLNDANQLRRDRSLAVADIRFADGTMHYLGVKIEQGGISVSVLRHSGQS